VRAQGGKSVGRESYFAPRAQAGSNVITTTIMESLEPQMEDRLFTVHPDESTAQTKAVGRMIAEQKAGIFEGLDPKKAHAWKLFHESLKPVDVVVPFAPSIMDFIEQTPHLPIATRRAANRVLTVIQTIACAYQHQRKRDSKDRIIAEIADYSMAHQIVQDAFRAQRKPPWSRRLGLPLPSRGSALHHARTPRLRPPPPPKASAPAPGLPSPSFYSHLSRP